LKYQSPAFVSSLFLGRFFGLVAAFGLSSLIALIYLEKIAFWRIWALIQKHQKCLASMDVCNVLSREVIFFAGTIMIDDSNWLPHQLSEMRLYRRSLDEGRDHPKDTLPYVRISRREAR
jgi:hypothetical protein